MSAVVSQTFEAMITVQTPVEGFTKPRFKIAITSNGHGKVNFDSAERAAFACPGCTKPTNLPREQLIAILEQRSHRFRFNCKRCDYPIAIVVEW